MAEAVRPRKHRTARNRGSTLGAETGNQSTADSLESGNEEKELVDALSGMKLDITYKEYTVLDKQRKVTQAKDKAKTDVQELFDALHEMLERKEVELNNKVDETFEDIEKTINEKIAQIQQLKDPVTKTLDEHKNGGNVSCSDLEEIHSATKSALQSNDNFSLYIEPIPSLSVSSNTKRIIEELTFGTFSNTIEGEARGISGHIETTFGIEPTDCEGRTETQGSDSSENVDSSNGALAQAVDSAESSEPSAPPIDLVSDPEESRAEDEEGVEAPPPYWEAIGLSGPSENEPSTPVHPPVTAPPYPEPAPEYSVYDTLYSSYDTPIPCDANTSFTSNTAEPWHSFPAKRQRDYRKPLYIAMSWAAERICLADRNNKKVKFFSCYGDFITEMNITSGEIHDVAFLECCNEEARYIITLPKERLLLLVGIMPDHTTKLVKKIPSGASGYTSICRGPFEHTLVGGVTPSIVAQYQPSQARVEVFDFRGRVVTVLDHTMQYGYFHFPRSVTCVKDMIIVSDWKLSLVASFNSNGAEVGTYKGTASSPLINPLDLTVDKYGKIMIVDGEFPNIHVITTDCIPVEVIRLSCSGSVGNNIKLAAFDLWTQWMAVMKSTGNIEVFSFKDGYKSLMPGMLPLDPGAPVSPVPSTQDLESLPYVEGMLPTTIANIGRQRRSTRQPQFFL